MLTTEFVPNSLYTRYLTRDLNFEDFCYRAAVQKKCLHSYVHPERIDAWFNMTFLPLEPSDGNIHYCTYTMEINFEPASDRLSNVNKEIASAVLEAVLKLRGVKDFKAAMGEVIKDIREICEAQYCCILLVDQERRTCTPLCRDSDKSAPTIPPDIIADENFYPIVESWKETIAGSNCLIMKSKQDRRAVRERNPVWYESLVQAGIKTIVLFPLKSQDALLGYLWATNFDPENSVKIKEALELTSFLIGSEIGTYLLVDQLRFLSSRDMLTGVMNRNEMNNFVTSMCDGEIGKGSPVGVIFADLNGLKEVNDVQGHAAGDELLKDAAAVLREVFDPKTVFRAGGDEFTIILIGATEEDVSRKIGQIREIARKHDALSFAIGGCAVDDGRDVRTALHRADELMYEDKNAYYERFPRRK
jgi:diguanylate cyclase (GGDEF)-like protein